MSRPDFAVDVEGFGTVLIEAKAHVSNQNVRNVLDQLRALLYSYPSAKAGFVVIDQPIPGGAGGQLVTIGELPGTLRRLEGTGSKESAAFAKLTPGTVRISARLPLLALSTTFELPVVSASAVVTATLATAVVGSAGAFLLVTGVLATAWQAIAAVVAVIIFVTASFALLLRFGSTSRLVWAVVGALQRVGRDLAITTVATIVGTIAGTLLTLLLTGQWP